MNNNTISYFFRNNGEVFVQSFIKGKQIKFSIKEKDFEFWLMENGKLTWEITRKEANGIGSKTIVGLASMFEYWQFGLSYIHNDLIEYITKNKTTKYVTNKLNS